MADTNTSECLKNRKTHTVMAENIEECADSEASDQIREMKRKNNTKENSTGSTTRSGRARLYFCAKCQYSTSSEIERNTHVENCNADQDCLYSESDDQDETVQENALLIMSDDDSPTDETSDPPKKRRKSSGKPVNPRFLELITMKECEEEGAEKVQYNCRDCPDFVTLKRQVAHTHVVRKHCQNNYLCAYCGFLCCAYSELRRHIRIRHPSEVPDADRAVKCPECGEGFPSEMGVKMHRLKHRRQEESPDAYSTKCKICERTFATVGALHAHRDAMHVNPERTYPCLECGRKFRNKYGLIDHMNVHTGKKPYVCSYPDCDKSFALHSTYCNHLGTHMKDFPCPVCSKIFHREYSLEIHKRTMHEKERNFACSICGKRFTQKSAQQRHERIHTGDKPFVCQDCDFKTGDASVLRRHRIKHERFQMAAKEKESSSTEDSQNNDSEVTNTNNSNVDNGQSNMPKLFVNMSSNSGENLLPNSTFIAPTNATGGSQNKYPHFILPALPSDSDNDQPNLYEQILAAFGKSTETPVPTTNASLWNAGNATDLSQNKQSQFVLPSSSVEIYNDQANFLQLVSQRSSSTSSSSHPQTTILKDLLFGNSDSDSTSITRDNIVNVAQEHIETSSMVLNPSGSLEVRGHDHKMEEVCLLDPVTTQGVGHEDSMNGQQLAPVLSIPDHADINGQSLVVHLVNIDGEEGSYILVPCAHDPSQLMLTPVTSVNQSIDLDTWC